MTRALVLIILAVGCALAACGDDDDQVKILVFQAAPDGIEAGQSARLVFAVDPPTAKLTISGLGDVTGQTQTSVTPTATTSYELTAVSGTATARQTAVVTVGPTTAVALAVEPAGAMPTAGNAFAVTLTALASNGKPSPGFRGTVHVASTDDRATLPADVTFAAGDAGVKQVMVTLVTAGLSTLTATETSNKAGATGAASLTVVPGPAAICATSQAPASAIAGSVLGLTVTLRDGFGNVATGYAGTMRLTATDPRANLPGDVTFVPLVDVGSHAFSVALLTTGEQTVTATDLATPSLACSASVAIAPAAPRLVLAVPGDANAGYPVNVAVTVVDLFDNAIPGYAGTVTFTSTDAGTGAITPAPIVFTGAEGGAATTSATFVTPGVQTLAASDAGAPQASGAAQAAIHGLIYTPPATGRVRLVANPAQSSAQVVQLDLVANERLELSTFFGGGPGSFSAGMNLPLDTTRVGPDAALFAVGNALPLGAGAQAAKGVIGPDHVLYTAVSRKRVAGTIFTQVTEVQAGQVFYSVRLKLAQAGTVGPVFDGGQPTALYRAAVRDQWGDDFVGQSEIGVGKLVVQ